MATPKCPPLELDPGLEEMIESYRAARTAAAAVRAGATSVERAGHYDKDTPLQTRTAGEADALAAERAAAVKLADRLLSWVDQRR